MKTDQSSVTRQVWRVYKIVSHSFFLYSRYGGGKSCLPFYFKRIWQSKRHIDLNLCQDQCCAIKHSCKDLLLPYESAEEEEEEEEDRRKSSRMLGRATQPDMHATLRVSRRVTARQFVYVELHKSSTDWSPNRLANNFDILNVSND